MPECAGLRYLLACDACAVVTLPWAVERAEMLRAEALADLREELAR